MKALNVVYRVILASFIRIILCSTMLASTASAQADNAFVMFDFILQPIAIKWACGAEPDQDLAVLKELEIAHPKDAEESDIRNIIGMMLEVSKRDSGVSQLFGASLSGKQIEKLCAAAMPLKLDWPAQLAGRERENIPPEQVEAWNTEIEKEWERFYQVFEEISRSEPPPLLAPPGK